MRNVAEGGAGEGREQGVLTEAGPWAAKGLKNRRAFLSAHPVVARDRATQGRAGTRPAHTRAGCRRTTDHRGLPSTP
jgi:hypothetical protein